jgi:hypothetical protein
LIVDLELQAERDSRRIRADPRAAHLASYEWHGSFETLEFGDPEPQIGDPRSISTVTLLLLEL